MNATFASAGNPRCATLDPRSNSLRAESIRTPLKPAALPPRLVAMEGTMKSQTGNESVNVASRLEDSEGCIALDGVGPEGFVGGVDLRFRSPAVAAQTLAIKNRMVYNVI